MEINNEQNLTVLNLCKVDDKARAEARVSSMQLDLSIMVPVKDFLCDIMSLWLNEWLVDFQ